MFIVEKHDEKSGITVFGRKERNGGQGVFLSAGFLKETKFNCVRSKIHALKSGYDRDSIFDTDTKIINTDGDTDCCFLAEIKLHIPPRGSVQHTFLMAVAGTAQEAVNKLICVRKSGGIREKKGAKAQSNYGNNNGCCLNPFRAGIVDTPKIYAVEQKRSP